MDQQTKEKLATQPNIYVDCKMLLGRLYDIRWKVPRRDRSYLFNDLLIPISLSLITHFALKVRLNEKKFYCQHYSKGIMCLGSMLKFDRIYTSNKTTESAFYRFSTARVCGPLKYVLPNMLASVNSTLGVFSGKTSFKVVSRLQECVSRRLGKFIELKSGKQSFIIREKFKRNLRRVA